MSDLHILPGPGYSHNFAEELMQNYPSLSTWQAQTTDKLPELIVAWQAFDLWKSQFINDEIFLHATADEAVEIAIKSIIPAVWRSFSFFPFIQETVQSVCKCSFPSLPSTLPRERQALLQKWGLGRGGRESIWETGQSRWTLSRNRDSPQILFLAPQDVLSRKRKSLKTRAERQGGKIWMISSMVGNGRILKVAVE